MSFHYLTITYNDILTRGAQSPRISVSPRFNNYSIISLVKLAILYQEITAHFQIYAIVVVAVRLDIKTTDNATLAHIKVYSPKGTFPDLKAVKQHIPATVQMNQMRTEVILTNSHLPFFHRNISGSHCI